MTTAYEQALVWSLLIDPTYVPDVRGRVRADDFADPTFRRMWTAIERLSDRHDPVSEESVRLEIQATGGQVDADKLIVGSPLPNTDEVPAYVRRILEARRAREVRLLLLAELDAPTTDERLHALIGKLSAAADDASDDDGLVSLSDSILAHVEDLDDQRTGRKPVAIMRYGIDSLDRKTGGAKPGELVVVAARPGDGKTAMALTVANHVAAEGGTVVFFSLEMKREELENRLLSAVAEINGRHFRNPTALTDADMRKIRNAAGELLSRKILIRDRPASMADVARICRRLKRRGDPPVLVVIDYLELLRPERRGERHDIELGERTKAAKRLGKEIECPVVMLVQVGRDAEKGNRRPTKADLRNSAEIEADADVVFMLYRLPSDSDPTVKSDTTEIIVAKGRGMADGAVKVRFRAEFTRFEEIAERALPGLPAGHWSDRAVSTEEDFGHA